MTVTLDASTALVVIDLQKGIVALPPAETAAAVVANAGRLAHAFRAQNRPVALVTVVGGAPGRADFSRAGGEFPADFADLSPELGAHPDDILVQKRTWGAFGSTDLHEQLAGRGITQIVLCGIATSIGVESTARFAHEYGYNVLIARDAVADANPAAHAHSVQTIFPMIAEVRETAEILTELG
ncbi:isochorismatase family protein [Actinospica robiniae]|uniref:isochorismatase family protein n=1 Tax=Actinospica robiniae TaxID=304901 RepID=UPI000414C291|nr:isochorismatase family protein [Actinospica robiniae]